MNQPGLLPPVAPSNDLILVSDPLKISQSGVIDLGVSDHLLTYCTRKIKKILYNKHNNVTISSLKKYSKEDFKPRLNETNWYDVYTCNSVEGTWLAVKSNIFGISGLYRSIQGC